MCGDKPTVVAYRRSLTSSQIYPVFQGHILAASSNQCFQIEYLRLVSTWLEKYRSKDPSKNLPSLASKASAAYGGQTNVTALDKPKDQRGHRWASVECHYID